MKKIKLITAAKNVKTLCDPCYKAHLVVKVTRNHTITDLPHRGTSPLPDGQMEAIIRGIISNSPLTSD